MSYSLLHYYLWQDDDTATALDNTFNFNILVEILMGIFTVNMQFRDIVGFLDKYMKSRQRRFSTSYGHMMYNCSYDVHMMYHVIGKAS